MGPGLKTVEPRVWPTPMRFTPLSEAKGNLQLL